MKCRLSSILSTAVTLLGICGVAPAQVKDWLWWPPVLLRSSEQGEGNILLTENNGARALAYGTNTTYATTVVAFALDGNIRVVRKQANNNTEEQPDVTACGGFASVVVSFGAQQPKKHAFWPLGDDLIVEYADEYLTSYTAPPSPWPQIKVAQGHFSYFGRPSLACKIWQLGTGYAGIPGGEEGGGRALARG